MERCGMWGGGPGRRRERKERTICDHEPCASPSAPDVSASTAATAPVHVNEGPGKEKGDAPSGVSITPGAYAFTVIPWRA